MMNNALGRIRRRLQLRRHMNAFVALALCMASATGQSLPPPSRTIYKCTNNKVVSYSDKPCLGAQRLVVTPTRGVSKLSGQERIGDDVREEYRREAFAEALRPISGMTPAQFEIHRRRTRLSSAAQAECRQLDPLLLRTEAMEAAAGKNTRATVQRELFMLRLRFTELGC